MHALGSETPTFDVYLPLKLPHLELATARVRPCEVTGVRVAAVAAPLDAGGRASRGPRLLTYL